MRDDLIGFTKADLLKSLLEDCFRGKLRDDQKRLTRALVPLVPLLALGSKSTSLSGGFSFVSCFLLCSFFLVLAC